MRDEALIYLPFFRIEMPLAFLSLRAAWRPSSANAKGLRPLEPREGSCATLAPSRHPGELRFARWENTPLHEDLVIGLIKQRLFVAVDRIGSGGKVTRENPSEGFTAIEKREELEARPQRNEKVDQVAKLYEKQFMREMVKAMRGTVDFGVMKPSMAENIYRDQLDDQYVESWSDKGGVGLSDVIYNQIMDRYFNTASGRRLKGQGEMIPVTDRDVSRVARVQSPQGQVPLRVEIKTANDGKPASLLAPWDAQVVSNSRLEGGKTALTLAHGEDLRSTFVFQGVASADAKPGARFEKGKAIGVLSPEIHSFLWNLKESAGPRSAE